jgi:hypothetical protein
MKTSFFYFSYAKDWKSILCAAEGKYGWKLALERNERSEFNFLFRDTAGFQSDLPGSGTQN